MTLTDSERIAFEKASEPLMKWLSENCHPHTTVILTQTSSELCEGIAAHRTMAFIKD